MREEIVTEMREQIITEMREKLVTEIDILRCTYHAYSVTDQYWHRHTVV